ncbi:hypothetical protein FQN54_001443 [Arachnomyces sp. PD_36]|nr:hypothetical protein FQN54_001443 [Arachnomyces sp. PD_36]
MARPRPGSPASNRGRAKPSSRGSSSGRGRGRGGRGRRTAGDSSNPAVPQIYQDMLIEISSSSSGVEEMRKRPVKRRRVGERSVKIDEEGVSDKGVEGEEERGGSVEDEGGGDVVDVGDESEKPIQTTYISDGSDESDMEWEEVDLEQQQPVLGQLGTPAADNDDEPLQLTLGDSSPKGKSPAHPHRRKPITAAERRWRLTIHKVHILCLLSHVYLRNLWCNDEDVQKSLPKILGKQTRTFLNPKEDKPQFTRSTTFVEGLKQAGEAFRRGFKVTAPGMRRPYWAEGGAGKQALAPLRDDEEIISSKSDFISQAKVMSGSRDFGAQVFCAILRSAGVEARLVCSLQVLPFSGVARGMNVVEPKPIIVLSEDGREEPSGSGAESSSPMPNAAEIPPQRIRRLGQPSFGNRPTYSPKGGRKLGFSPHIQASPYPVFWVEAFNEAVQKWIPVDPLVTNTVAKPSKFEPPASDRYNNMSYVIAFEDDASARDVTKRYTKSYNAKTRKTRVESTKDGEEWWEKTMEFFERPFLEDRDQVEFGDLTARSAAEPMPRNIQDFKDHPVYALERHLRRNEVIHPRRVIGQVSAGKPGAKKGNSALEQVFRRGDVKTVRSADGWYRLGRDIKVGEQPLKRVPATRKAGERMEEGDDTGSEAPLTALYAEDQTELYEAPPIVNGRVPRNVYGNLDVNVPTMVPPGGTHIRHDEAARAARILGIDYADAVTGFEFKGRQGTAVVKGIVAASEYCEAIYEVLSCLEDERVQAELDRRTAEALRMWRHLLVKMRVAERVNSYVVEGEHDEQPADTPMGDYEDYGGGGFCAEDAEETTSQYAVGLRSEPQEYVEGDQSDGSEVEGSVPSPETGDGSESAPPTGIAGGDGGDIGTASTQMQRSTVPKPQQRYTLIVMPNEKGSGRSKETKPNTSLPPASDNKPDHPDPMDLDKPPQEQPVITTLPEPLGEGSASLPTIVDSSSEEKTGKGAEVEAPEASASAPQKDSDSEIDQGSMLSHDPEDEDAEPEWLLSD